MEPDDYDREDPNAVQRICNRMEAVLKANGRNTSY